MHRGRHILRISVHVSTLVALLTWVTPHRHLNGDSLLQDCLVLVQTEPFALQYDCHVDQAEFPVPTGNRSRADAKHKNVRYRAAFLHVRVLNSQRDVYQPLQHLAGLSNVFSILFTVKDGYYTQHSPNDYTKKDRVGSTMLEEIGTHAWWKYTLSISGLRISKVIWKHDGTQVLIRVRGRVQCDPCNCGGNLPHIRPDNGVFPSCAVVMNSGLLGNMTRPRLGDAIDAHGAVFRINEGPAGGFYARIAGTKTTFRIIYPNPKTLHSVGEEILLFSVHYKSERQLINAAIRSHNFLPHQRVIEIPKKFRECVKKCMNLPGRHPSTGMVSVVIATSMCDRITVFGKSLMVDSLDTSKFAYHYFEDNAPGVTSEDFFSPFHRPDLEKEFYTRLSDLGVNFVP